MLPRSVSAPPAETLSLLRAHAAGSVVAGALCGTGARPFTGGYRNAVYLWQSPDGPVAVKIYRNDSRRLAGREWLALTLLDRHRPGFAPAPLWTDPCHEQPVGRPGNFRDIFLPT
jgi:hypothetical protein